MVKAKTRKNSLGLAGDGDEIHLVQAVEAGFGITFKNADLEQSLTVGDLYRLVRVAMPNVDRGTTACPSALAFYRLRRAMKAQGAPLDIRPSTPLAALTGRFGAAQFHRRLKRDSGLALPQLALGLTPVALGIATVAALFLCVPWWGWQGVLIPIVLAPITYGAGRVLQSFSQPTVGDLARVTGAMNLRRLLPGGAALRTRETWESLVTLLRHESGWDGAIDPETLLIG